MSSLVPIEGVVHQASQEQQQAGLEAAEMPQMSMQMPEDGIVHQAPQQQAPSEPCEPWLDAATSQPQVSFQVPLWGVEQQAPQQQPQMPMSPRERR